jgi:Domain of unknown function (DUF6362)
MERYGYAMEILRNNSRAFGSYVEDLDSNDVEQAGRDLQWLRAMCELAEEALVTRMRADGCSWAEVGRVVGVTRQAAHERWRDALAALEL